MEILELSWSSWSLIDESASESPTPFDEIVVKIWRNKNEYRSSFNNAIFALLTFSFFFFDRENAVTVLDSFGFF